MTSLSSRQGAICASIQKKPDIATAGTVAAMAKMVKHTFCTVENLATHIHWMRIGQAHAAPGANQMKITHGRNDDP